MNPYTYIKSLFQDWRRRSRRRQVERQLALISLQYERAVMESRKRGDTEHLQKISAAMTVLRNEVKEW
jgi:hypothetical protein